ncbi:phage tail assembly chaperone [Pseudochrobactrum sp. MP213Fo]|uniref:phage tail assembly chaperone n=1 Tax=Pseudochrobactrum sp. MP213Fo TaxID=3022250 RepID=UPI003B9EF1A3
MSEQLISHAKKVFTARNKRQEGSLVSCPFQLEHVWNWFLDLHNNREYTEFGPKPIRYSEILAYSTLMQVPIYPAEVELIIRLDDVVTAIMADKKGSGSGDKVSMKDPEGVKNFLRGIKPSSKET